MNKQIIYKPLTYMGEAVLNIFGEPLCFPTVPVHTKRSRAK